MLEHRFAIFTALATFVLLLIGGTVNPTGSSLACPEPTLICNGQLFPEMTGGVLYEHGHRLVAMTVGFLQIALTILLWRRRPALRWLGVGALALVCGQGALGAITVAYKLPTEVSMAHLVTAMGYFALLLYLAWRTRPAHAPAADDIGSARGWVVAAMVVVLAQIALGGMVRHTGGTLACLDVTCGGTILPHGALPLQMHLAHRIGGIIVGLVVIAGSIVVFRRASSRTLRWMAAAAPLLVALQITLGVLTIMSLRSVPVAVAHFGGAAALWGLWVTMFFMTGSGARAPVRTRGATATAAEATPA
jgi:heme a synthase